jgi:hydroxyacylglutathione hydrolase
VYEPASPDTVLVDPGEDAERFLAEAARRARRITAIWLTHAHLDHIAGVSAVHRVTGAAIHLHPADRALYEGLPEQGRWFGLELDPAPPPDVMLHHGQRLAVGDRTFEVRHLPGHSPGHVCFVGSGVVLGGDVLFEGSIGRTDLPGGDLEALLTGIRRELLVLPDDTIVYPGHGPATTIGREREENPFLVQFRS